MDFPRMRNLPKNTNLYRGSASPSVRNNLSYFIFGNQNVAVKTASEQYATGFLNKVWQYKTNRNLKLVKLDNANSVKFLKNLVKNNTNLLGSFNRSFKVSNGNVFRHSNKNDDEAVAKFLCTLGYDGYITNAMRKNKNNNSKFHPEIVLCKPKDKVKVTNTFTPFVGAVARNKGTSYNLYNAQPNTFIPPPNMYAGNEFTPSPVKTRPRRGTNTPTGASVRSYNSPPTMRRRITYRNNSNNNKS